MGKVGRFVTDPRAGAYCQITLDSGDKIMVSHDKGGFQGGSLAITQVKWMGLGSGETLFTCDLDGPAGKTALARLTKGVEPGSAHATPLYAFVDHVKDCRDLAHVKTKCAAIPSLPE